MASNIENEQIFQIFHPNDNTQFFELNATDLLDFVILLNDFYLSLRKQIGLKHTSTFGLELEFENADRQKIADQLTKCNLRELWKMKDDASLHDGAEINSPILRDSEKNWKDLEQVCSIVSNYASIEKKSGGHIHVGTQVLGDHYNSWIHFIELWSIYENILFRFFYGEYLGARPFIIEYAGPISCDLWNAYQKTIHGTGDISKILFKISPTRHQAVNFRCIKKDNYSHYEKNNTIEFRCPNGSLDPVIWQNNVNTIMKMLYYCKSPKYDQDKVLKRHELLDNQFYDISLYGEIYLDQVLEFVDMIFDNNQDKIYFLKQYLKSFQVVLHHKDYLKGKTFTKKINH